MLRSMDFSLHICPQHARPTHNDGVDFNFRSWFLSHIHIRIISFFLRDCDQIPNDTPWLHSNYFTLEADFFAPPLALVPCTFARFFFARHPEVSLYKTIILNLPSDCTVVRMYSSLSPFFKNVQVICDI